MSDLFIYEYCGVTSHDCCCFRTETTVTETHRDEACGQGVCYFLFTEVTFGSDEHQYVPALLYLVPKDAFVLFVAMGDELLMVFLSYLSHSPLKEQRQEEEGLKI